MVFQIKGVNSPSTQNTLNKLSKNVKIYAFTAAKLVITYTHECISSILNAAGVKTG